MAPNNCKFTLTEIITLVLGIISFGIMVVFFTVFIMGAFGAFE